MRSGRNLQKAPIVWDPETKTDAPRSFREKVESVIYYESENYSETYGRLSLTELGLAIRNRPGVDLDRWINDRPQQSEFEDDVCGWVGEFDW
jgi:hypothetical protein